MGQLRGFLGYRGDTWASRVMELICEWRFYVQHGEVIGRARYDPDGADDALEPKTQTVLSAISAFQDAPSAYTLDFGVTEDGETVLIEVNDAWAIGLYGKSLAAEKYFDFLHVRFQELKRFY